VIQPDARDRALDYLAAHRVMNIATLGTDGLWAAAVFYVSDGFNLYFVSSPSSRHGRNFELHPEVAATVNEDYSDWREIKGVQLEGIVGQVAGSEQASIRGLYARKFSLEAAPAGIAAAFARVCWYRLAAARAYFVDNAAGFGHRDQVL
jgi:uncharacterized protein YhbP (UPF0306 family)